MKFSSVTPTFWADKKVFLTGHTGFKGGWLSLWLTSMGAKVVGFALEPNTQPNLFEVLKVSSLIEKSHIGDVQDFEYLNQSMFSAQPDVLIHMAAQPLVRYSYSNPVETYATNVMGTVHVLEASRQISSLKATVIVTTDKCYENKEWEWGYRENDPMGGYDPYSNSKGCAELVTAAYRQSFFSQDKWIKHQNAVASARAGNVIGGGDWSKDRLIPDAIKAFEARQTLKIRNPLATRPWQHVLEPLSGYLILAQALYERGMIYASPWNFGPQDEDVRSVQEVINLLIKQWGCASWEKEGEEQPHEANFLKLDCSKARQHLAWVPKWNLETAIKKSVDWQRAFQEKKDMQEISLSQIKQYMNN
ncbi:CDP-glucose 4,6-dehydratase [Polynucleobacter sp. MWH-UH24A]|uniref:CDP-glucose 4,6-dehydratase n=1 Tax=Polynucleobacter sp. MWH-UH24A TaxID=2689110 RepID=UPI001BFEDB57|nr:CDP-glucose 4,6-dehydratase [Polynucleobacter sp. MWH-UH24A]QWD76407.1 CDP-glucose 4,6-dehydratase [Polynucleobacter sp. MWH-UH24A]